jgi:hypothetical protein
MKAFVLAIVIAFGAFFGSSAQAASALSSAAVVQGQLKGDAVKVWHCRRRSGG